MLGLSAIPAKDMPPKSVLCRCLDDMLKYFKPADNICLTDLLLMTGNASPAPGFSMLVQYVASLCSLHSIPAAQVQLRLHNQQTLHISEAVVLAHGHKSLVVRLGQDAAVYKVGLIHLVSLCVSAVNMVFASCLERQVYILLSLSSSHETCFLLADCTPQTG